MPLRRTKPAKAAQQKRRLKLDFISLDGFKAVKSASKIPIGGLTLLIGRNGSGKSSIVEALQWLQESLFWGLQRATEDRFRRYTDLRNLRSKETSIHLEFSGVAEAPVQYDLTVKKKVGFTALPIVFDERLRVRKVSAQRSLIWTRKGPTGPAVRNIKGGNPERDSDRLALASGRSGADVAESLREFLRNLVVLRLSPTSMTQSVPLERRARGPMLDEQGSGLPALLAGMKAAQREWVASKLADINPDITGVKPLLTDRERGTFSLTESMVKQGGSGEFDIPAWMLSEGMRRMTAIFTLLAVEPQPSLIVIEEIENGLDPWTLEYVLRELHEASERGIQLLLTTHSPFLLDHVKPAEVIHVRRTKGNSTYTPVSSYVDVAKFGGVVAPGAMYLAGYYQDEDAE